jgi:hypothetical protein
MLILAILYLNICQKLNFFVVFLNIKAFVFGINAIKESHKSDSSTRVYTNQVRIANSGINNGSLQS